MVDAGGCVMGYAAGQLYCRSVGSSMCYSEAKWYTSPSSDGQICKRRSGASCGDNVKEGNWDSSDSKCVVCNGGVETGYFDCNGDYGGDNKCESACGASPECDEIYPYSFLPDICGEKQLNVIRYCDESCKYFSITYTCDSSHACDVRICGGQTYYCVYDSNPLVRKWIWSTSIPSGFCCSNNDCPAYNSTNHLKMYCDTSTHTCKTIEKCRKNDECEGNWCCDDKTPTYQCVYKGKIISSGGKSYLCDPPEGFVNSNENTNIQVSKKLTLLDLLINPFSYFFKR
jgi:hypothetical protein